MEKQKVKVVLELMLTQLRKNKSVDRPLYLCAILHRFKKDGLVTPSEKDYVVKLLKHKAKVNHSQGIPLREMVSNNFNCMESMAWYEEGDFTSREMLLIKTIEDENS